MKKLTAAILTLALAAALAACGQAKSPDDSPTSTDYPIQTGHVIGIRPAETRDPSEPITFPAETYPVVGPDTDIDPNMGVVPVDKVITLYGNVVEYVATEPMENVLAVEVWDYTTGTTKIYHLYISEDVAYVEEFCVGDYVSFTYDPAAEPMDSYDGTLLLSAIRFELAELAAEKPVIYLYPETPTEVSVKLVLDGELTCTYPAYGEGWNNFTAYPDGTLIAPDGKEYYCLYWEGKQNTEWDFSEGFCVKGSDTAAFLEWALAARGLTPREANEFIIYWLPRMEQNPYNVISFQTTPYTDTAVLDVTPTPDTLIRVFMAWYPSEEAVEMEAQELETVERRGFTAVEWGGSEMERP